VESNRSEATVYEVACHSCQQTFDALQTSWCNCVVTKRSLMCPSCRTCFCRAPLPYKQKFWQGAPRLLWDRAAVEHNPPESLPPNPSPDSAVHPLVLVVDDEPDIQRMTSVAVALLGFGVLRASNGEEGLALMKSHRPDVVRTDAFMPGMDGREMCRRIKADPVTSSVPVVIMTSLYTASRYKYEAYKEFGADDYLAKPLEMGEVQAVLRKQLG
jgi:CheY-like chemotaxis protein